MYGTLVVYYLSFMYDLYSNRSWATTNTSVVCTSLYIMIDRYYMFYLVTVVLSLLVTPHVHEMCQSIRIFCNLHRPPPMGCYDN